VTEKITGMEQAETSRTQALRDICCVVRYSVTPIIR